MDVIVFVPKHSPLGKRGEVASVPVVTMVSHEADQVHVDGGFVNYKSVTSAELNRSIDLLGYAVDVIDDAFGQIPVIVVICQCVHVSANTISSTLPALAASAYARHRSEFVD